MPVNDSHNAPANISTSRDAPDRPGIVPMFHVIRVIIPSFRPIRENAGGAAQELWAQLSQAG